MKKITVLAFALLAGALSAQTNFGVKAGFGLSTVKVTSQGMSIDGNRPTFYVGGLVEHQFSRVALQGELQYTQLGGKVTQGVSSNFDGELINYSASLDMNLGSIMLPLLVKYYITDSFSLGAGVNMGFLINKTGKLTATVNGMSVPEDFIDNSMLEMDKAIKSMSFSPLVNAEYKINDHFSVDARYIIPVSDVSKNIEDAKVVIGQMQVGAGYRF